MSCACTHPQQKIIISTQRREDRAQAIHPLLLFKSRHSLSSDRPTKAYHQGLLTKHARDHRGLEREYVMEETPKRGRAVPESW